MSEDLKKVGNFTILDINAYDPYIFAKDKISKKLFICRELSKEEKKEKNIERFSDLNNSNLLTFKKEQNYIFWEFLNGGTLQSFHKYLQFKQNLLNEIQIQKIVIQILNGLEALNKKEKVYGGISPDKIFMEFTGEEKPVIGNNRKKNYTYYDKFIENEDLCSYKLKLQYFISSEERKKAINPGEDDFNNNEKSMYYMAPEILNNFEYNSDPLATNIWSLGVITLSLLTGNEKPFEGENYNEVFKSIIDKKIFIPANLCPSLQIISFITRLLKYNPKDRPSLEKIKEFEFLNKDPLNFDFLSLELLCRNEKNLILNLEEKDPINKYLINTRLENRIGDFAMKEAENYNIKEKISMLEKQKKQLDINFLNIKNPSEKQIEDYTQNINAIILMIKKLNESIETN